MRPIPFSTVKGHNMNISINKVHLFTHRNFSRTKWFRAQSELEKLASSIATRGYQTTHGLAKVYKLSEASPFDIEGEDNKNEFELAKEQREQRAAEVDLNATYNIMVDDEKVQVTGLEYRNALQKMATVKPSHGLVAQFGRFTALTLANVALQKAGKSVIEKVQVEEVQYKTTMQLLQENISENALHKEGRREVSWIEQLRGASLMFVQGAKASQFHKAFTRGTGDKLLFICELDQMFPEEEGLQKWLNGDIPLNKIDHQTLRQVKNKHKENPQESLADYQAILEDPAKFTGKNKTSQKIAAGKDVKEYAENRTKNKFVRFILGAVYENDMARLATLVPHDKVMNELYNECFPPQEAQVDTIQA